MPPDLSGAPVYFFVEKSPSAVTTNGMREQQRCPFFIVFTAALGPVRAASVQLHRQDGVEIIEGFFCAQSSALLICAGRRACEEIWWRRRLQNGDRSN